MTTTTVVATTIEDFAPEEWNRCFPGDPENWAFYRACEQAGPPGFVWYYAAVLENDRPIAIVPAFGTVYRLDTTIQGGLKRIAERLYRMAPRLLSLRLLAIGSPVAEICHAGFAPDIPQAQKAGLLRRIVGALQIFSGQEDYGLLGIKDAPAQDDKLWTDALHSEGFTRLPGLPTAILDLPYGSFDEYLGSLSRATRKDMRRKAKTFDNIRVEQRQNVDDVIDRLACLYEQTLARSDLQFERLPPGYFPEILRRLTPNSSVFLYWADDRLIAFNLIIEAKGRLIDKYIGMDYAVVKKYNTYFNTWLYNIQYCLNRKLPIYQGGQSFYGPKLRLGCQLQPNWQFFRHRNPILNAILLLVVKVVRLDRFDPVIADLVKEAP